MSSQLRRVCYAMFFVCLQVSVSSADFIVAQNLPASQQYGDSFYDIGVIATQTDENNPRVGQSFISNVNAKITTIDALVTAGNFGPIADSPPLDVSLYESESGIPTALLGSVQRPASDFTYQSSGIGQRATFDFSPLNIPLVAGQNYMVVFSTPFGINGLSGFDAPYLVAAALSSRNPIASVELGEFASFAPHGSDWNITIEGELTIAVNGAPEPCGLALSLLGLTAFARRIRTRSTRAR